MAGVTQGYFDLTCTHTTQTHNSCQWVWVWVCLGTGQMGPVGMCAGLTSLAGSVSLTGLLSL